MCIQDNAKVEFESVKFDLATRIICSLSAKESASLITICELTSETAVLSVLKSTSEGYLHCWYLME